MLWQLERYMANNHSIKYYCDKSVLEKRYSHSIAVKNLQYFFYNLSIYQTPKLLKFFYQWDNKTKNLNIRIHCF